MEFSVERQVAQGVQVICVSKHSKMQLCERRKPIVWVAADILEGADI